MAKCIAWVLMPMRTVAEQAQNAIAPRNARGKFRPREKPLEGAILQAALSIWILAIELTFLGANSTRPARPAPINKRLISGPLLLE